MAKVRIEPSWYRCSDCSISISGHPGITPSCPDCGKEMKRDD